MEACSAKLYAVTVGPNYTSTATSPLTIIYPTTIPTSSSASTSISAPTSTPISTPIPGTYQCYTLTSDFPDATARAPWTFDALWNQFQPILQQHNSDQELSQLYDAITTVAAGTGFVDRYVAKRRTAIPSSIYSLAKSLVFLDRTSLQRPCKRLMVIYT